MAQRIAIVGLGHAARGIHLPAIRKLPQLQLVGGYDLEAPAGALGLPVFSSLDEMLTSAKPDIVVIATPPHTHGELSRRALLSGSHVFCEKPIAESLEEIDALAAVARSVDRHVVVNSEFPYMPIHTAAKRRMQQPGFGALQFIAMHQTFLITEASEEGWRGEGLQRTFREFGTHVLDLAQFFFDETPRSVRARMPKPAGADSPDYLNLVELEFSGDRIAHIMLDRLSRGRHRYLDIRLDGTEATIETQIGGRLQTTVGLRARDRRPFIDIDIAMGGTARLYRGERYERLATAPINVLADATAHLLAEMSSAIEQGQTPPSSLAAARRTLQLLIACYDSASDGQPRVIP